MWILSSVSPREYPITAEFTDGRVSGTSGVNTYSGPYRVGPGTALSVGPITTTEIAGSEAAMRVETAYLTLLDEAKSFKMTGHKLTLYDEFGSESMNFEIVSE